MKACHGNWPGNASMPPTIWLLILKLVFPASEAEIPK